MGLLFYFKEHYVISSDLTAVDNLAGLGDALTSLARYVDGRNMIAGRF